MNRNDSLSLWNALNSNSLKAKPITPANFVKLLNLKKKLRDYVGDMIESEKELAASLPGLDENDPIYKNKLQIIQETEFEQPELNFLTEREMQWNEETGAGFALVLTEHLLKIE